MRKRFESIELLDHPPPFSAALIRELGVRGLHCGSGQRLLPGWLNTDLLPVRTKDGSTSDPGRIVVVDGRLFLQHDATTPFPIEDESFDWIYSEAFIQHLAPRAAVEWLREARRMLKPQGLLRIGTPNLRKYAAAYLAQDASFLAQRRDNLRRTLAPILKGSEESLRGRRLEIKRDFLIGDDDVPDRPGFLLNELFYLWDSKWVYDFEELRHVAILAGFDPESIVECDFAEGSIPEVHEYDRRMRKDESLYVELTRV